MVAAVLCTQLPAGFVFEATEKDVIEGGVAPIYPGDCESMMFMYESVGALLALVSKVAIGETVLVGALMSTVV